MLGPGPGLRCSRCGCRVSVSALVTVTVLGLRLRLVIEKLTGTRLTLVPSLRSAPTRDSGELVSASCRSLRECAGVVLTPEPAYPAGAAAGGAGAGAVWSGGRLAEEERSSTSVWSGTVAGRLTRLAGSGRAGAGAAAWLRSS